MRDVLEQSGADGRLSALVVRGAVERLWEASYECGEAVLGDSVDIAAVAEWPFDPDALVGVLLKCGGTGAGLIEPSPEREGVFQVHDLLDHAPEYVVFRREREGERKKSKRCAHCGCEFRSTKREARFCSTACRQGAYRARRGDGLVTDGGVTAPECEITLRHSDVSPAPAPAPAPAPTLNAHLVDVQFQEFWKMYPRKVARVRAEKAFGALSIGDRAAVVAAVGPWVESWWRSQANRGRENLRFMPHPTSWLRARRWTDELEPDSTTANVGEPVHFLAVAAEGY